MQLSSKNRKTILFTFFAILVYLRYGNGVFIQDGMGYFGYLPALVFEGHLNFFEYFKSCGVDQISATPTGLATNFWSPGVAFFWFPFFLMAIGLFKMTGLSLFPYCSYPVFYMTNSGTYLYGLLIILLVASILKKMNFKKSRWTILIPALFGTPLFFYMTFGAAMSHVPSTVSLCAFAWLCLHRWKNMNPNWVLFLMGLIGGLMMMVRMENVVFFILLLVPLRRFNLHLRPHEAGALARSVGFFMLGFLVTFSPQLFVWHKLYGTIFTMPKVQNVSTSRFVLHEILFSPFHGLLFWNPVMILAMLGYLFAWWHPKRKIIALFGGCFLTQVLICSFLESWWSWYSFGNRVLTSAFLPVVVGLSCPLVVMKSETKKRALVGLYFLSALWTAGLFVNYDIGKLNIGLITVGRDLYSLQFGLIKNPLEFFRAIVNFPKIFWQGFLFFSFLGVTSIFVSKWLLDKKKWSGVKLITVLIALNGFVFLGLTVRAALATPTKAFSDREKEHIIFYDEELDYLLFHGRLTEIQYLIKMQRVDSAEKLFSDTINRYEGTKTWQMFEEQNKREITSEDIYKQLFGELEQPSS